MKVVLDLTKLLNEGDITQAEYDKLSHFASQETSSLAFNILVGFGVVAVSAAVIALFPTAMTTLFAGLILSVLGLGPMRLSLKWKLLSQICVLIGSLLSSGGILWMFDASTASWLFVTVLLAVVGIIICHGLLIVLSVLTLSVTVGGATGYEHAMYMVAIEQPTVTIVLFSLLSFVAYRISSLVPFNYQRLAILVSRTSLFLVNFGFWIGSLWGDTLAKHAISEMYFVVLWALGLIATAIWATKTNRRWVFNLCAVFGAIHFYTQWFERLGATPFSVLLAGIIALVVAVLIRHMNTTFENKM